MTAGRRHLQGVPRHRLAAHVGEVGHRLRHRRVGGVDEVPRPRPGEALDDGVQIGRGVDRALAATARLEHAVGRRDDLGVSERVDHRGDPRHRSQCPVEAELAQEGEPRQRLERHLAVGGEHADGDGEIEPGAPTRTPLGARFTTIGLSGHDSSLDITAGRVPGSTTRGRPRLASRPADSREVRARRRAPQHLTGLPWTPNNVADEIAASTLAPSCFPGRGEDSGAGKGGNGPTTLTGTLPRGCHIRSRDATDGRKTGPLGSLFAHRVGGVGSAESVGADRGLRRRHVDRTHGRHVPSRSSTSVASVYQVGTTASPQKSRRRRSCTLQRSGLLVGVTGEVVAGVDLDPVPVGVAQVDVEGVRHAVAAGAALDVVLLARSRRACRTAVRPGAARARRSRGGAAVGWCRTVNATSCTVGLRCIQAAYRRWSSSIVSEQRNPSDS